jgi:hypothetical protein
MKMKLNVTYILDNEFRSEKDLMDTAGKAKLEILQALFSWNDPFVDIICICKP